MGRSGGDRGPHLGQLRKAVGIAKHVRAPRASPSPISRTGVRAHFAKGVATRATKSSPTQRRVVVKARYVSHGAARGAPLRTHVSYLAREAGPQKSAGDPAVEQRQANDLERSVDYLAREGR